MHRVAAAIVATALMSSAARADDLVVYAAGSLREAIGQIAFEFSQASGITVKTEFGPSGRMRERIEKGERVDLFTSADLGHARKLVDDGRASLMAVFVRNALCVLSPAKFGATTETLIDKMLAPGIRISVSTPKVDPLGDYTLKLFEQMETIRPGSQAAMQARAVVLDTPPGAPPPKSGDTNTDAILDGRVDASIVYCSGRARYTQLLPSATVADFPPELNVGPEYGLALLKNANPAAAMLALTILSPAGQKILADHGFRPVTLPAKE